MKKYLAVILILFCGLELRSQSFAASAIPDSLKINASVVVRLEEMTVEIKSPGHAVCHEHHVYSILNESADYYSTYRSFYDKFTAINYVNATLYDADGKELKHFKKKDMQDVAAQSGETLTSDERYKTGSFYCHQYPYTVDFEEEDEIEGILRLSGWYLPTSEKCALECSRYSIVAPKEYKVRYKLVNASFQPTVSEKNGKVSYRWEIRNRRAIPDEPFAVSEATYEPFMLVGPSAFEAEGYKGDMSTWKDYGRFYHDLLKGRDVLPEDVKQKVHALVDTIRDLQKKVACLYDYMQKNTHYVGIQLGIGGFQPFDASYVARNKYGDCKALSNFMVALLKEAGIKGHSVIIRSGKDNTEFVPDFACHQFDHVICCVPMQKDSIWLECTDQYLPAGYLSSFTADRFGLLIDEDGGTLVHTPAYLLKDNIQIRKIQAVLDAEGNLQVQCNANYQAECQDITERFIHHYSKDEQLRVLKGKFDLPSYDVNSFDYQCDYGKRLPVIRESLHLTVANYSQVSGKRIFINPDILTRSSVKLMEDKNRQLDIGFKDEFSHLDSVQIAIPAGYETESLPEDLLLKSKFGNYTTHTLVLPDKIVYYRRFDQYSGRFSAKEYGELVKFYNQIYASDHSRIVLVKKT